MSAPSLGIWAISRVVLQCACSAAADITPQKPGDHDHPNVRRKSMTTHFSYRVAEAVGLIGTNPNALKSVGHIGLAHQYTAGRALLPQTNYFRDNFGQRFCAQDRRDAVRVCVCVEPSFFSLLRGSEHILLLIRTLRVTTAPRGDTRKFGISFAADLCITKHFCRMTLSLIHI